jgi:hypothetical protein
MTEIPQWHVVGDWFDACNCRVPCPCTFAQPPTEGHCEGILAYHVREGSYGDVPLDGLNVVGLGEFEGNIWDEDTKATMGVIIDERADERQREALQAIFGGQVGGWPGQFIEAALGEFRGVEFARIDIDVADDLGQWSCDVPGKARARAEALGGPTTPPGKRVQVHNAGGSEVGPGAPATYAVATESRASALGFAFEWPGRSSKHIPFDWSGPDAG